MDESSHQYFKDCIKNNQIPLPAFAKVRNDTLYLSEFLITDI